MTEGVVFGEFHSERDWKLFLTDLDMGKPVPRINGIIVPGRDGELYLSESRKTVYNNRNLKFEFEFQDGNYNSMFVIEQRVTNYLHGKKHKIILDADKSYYYDGICTVDVRKINVMVSKITINVDAYPYKLDVHETTDKWKWSTFSFDNGIIRYYKDIVVNNQKEVSIIGSDRYVVPTIITSSAMSLDVEGKTYVLKPGEQKLYELMLEAREYTFVFTGNGKISIKFRGGSL